MGYSCLTRIKVSYGGSYLMGQTVEKYKQYVITGFVKDVEPVVLTMLKML